MVRVVKSSDDVSNIPDDLGLLMIESHAMEVLFTRNIIAFL